MLAKSLMQIRARDVLIAHILLCAALLAFYYNSDHDYIVAENTFKTLYTHTFDIIARHHSTKSLQQYRA
jgi:hypothetical protein